MRKLLAYLVAAALLVAVEPALAAITIIGSATVPLASANEAAGSSTITSSAASTNVGIGSLVYIASTSRSVNNNFTACTDSVGNTYPAVTKQGANGGAQTLGWTYAITTIAITTSTTFSCSGGPTTNHGIRVLALSGVASHDATGSATPTQGTGTVMSATGGTMACPGGAAGCEAVVVSWTNRSMGAQSSLSYSPSGVTTTLGCDTSNSAAICLGYGIFGVTTAQTFSSTNASSDVWAMDFEAFQTTSSGATQGCLVIGSGVTC